MQVYLTQVCTTQVQAFALDIYFIVLVKRPVSLMMDGEKPLYIGADERYAFEWVDALLDVGYDTTPLCKILLSFGINFWLSTPLLALRSIHLT